MRSLRKLICLLLILGVFFGTCIYAATLSTEEQSILFTYFKMYNITREEQARIIGDLKTATDEQKVQSIKSYQDAISNNSNSNQTYSSSNKTQNGSTYGGNSSSTQNVQTGVGSSNKYSKYGNMDITKLSWASNDNPFNRGVLTDNDFDKDIVTNYIVKSSFYVCDNSANDTPGNITIGITGPSNMASKPCEIVFKDTVPARTLRVIIYDVGT